VDLALGLDGAKDPARRRGGIEDAIECDPITGIDAAGALVEVERGFLADIEGLPGQDCLLLCLLDGDVAPAAVNGLGWEPGPLPQVRPWYGARRDLQAARDEAIGNAARGGERRIASSLLRRLHGLQSKRRAREGAVCLASRALSLDLGRLGCRHRRRRLRC